MISNTDENNIKKWNKKVFVNTNLTDRSTQQIGVWWFLDGAVASLARRGSDTS